MKKFKLAAIVAVSLSVAQPTLAAVGGVKAPPAPMTQSDGGDFMEWLYSWF
ncbi:hypothetical protein [Paraglaciecola sp.]|uniref:hypothetical protein n=1 Tax=Paraglaciecola sp. TaxID=1920173 RepID=UPI0030F407E1